MCPKVCVLDGAPFTAQSGGELAFPTDHREVQFVPFGHLIHGKVTSRQDGKISLDLKLEHTLPIQGETERIDLHTNTTRTLGSFKLGETVTIELGKQRKEAQIWAEVTVEELKEAAQE
jgi:hypothetical protein